MTDDTQTEALLPSREALMAQAQVFASAWAIAGSRFDSGDGMEVAEQEKAILADMTRRQHARIAELEAQLEAIGAGGVSGPLMGQPQAMPDLSALTERGAKAWAGVDARELRDGGADMSKEREAAEKWLRDRYGAYRGHFAWRELEEAFLAGRASLAVSAGSGPLMGKPQAMPHWMQYDERTDVLTIHGKRYAAGMFGEDGFLSPPGTWLRVCVGAEDCVTLSRASLAASAVSEPVAYAIFAENGQIRLWSVEAQHVERIAEEKGLELVKLYTHPSPPEGMVMVPREPTMAMRIAAKKADMDHTNLSDWMVRDWPEFKRIWDAMLKAAPPTTSAGSGKGE